MKNLILKSLGALALASFALTAQAIPITGGISLAGAYTSNTGNLNTATAFTSFTGVVSTGTAGTLASANITNFVTPFTMNGFVFGTAPNGAGNNTPLQIWTTGPNGGITTTFTLSSISSVDHNPTDTVTVIGNGFFTETGYDQTAGTFIFSANQAGGTFSFSLSHAALAPDGGTTALLLGLGLVGLGFSARRFKSVKA